MKKLTILFIIGTLLLTSCQKANSNNNLVSDSQNTSTSDLNTESTKIDADRRQALIEQYVVPGKTIDFFEDSKVYFTDGRVITLTGDINGTETETTIPIANFDIEDMRIMHLERIFSYCKEDETSVAAVQKIIDFCRQSFRELGVEEYPYKNFFNENMDKLKSDFAPYLKEGLDIERAFKINSVESIPYSIRPLEGPLGSGGMEILTFKDDTLLVDDNDIIIYYPKSEEMWLDSRAFRDKPVFTGVEKVEIVNFYFAGGY